MLVAMLALSRPLLSRPTMKAFGIPRWIWRNALIAGCARRCVRYSIRQTMWSGIQTPMSLQHIPRTRPSDWIQHQGEFIRCWRRRCTRGMLMLEELYIILTILFRRLWMTTRNVCQKFEAANTYRAMRKAFTRRFATCSKRERMCFSVGVPARFTPYIISLVRNMIIL